MSPSSQVHARCKFAISYGRKPQKQGISELHLTIKGNDAQLGLIIAANV